MRLILTAAVIMIAAGVGLGLWVARQADEPDTAAPRFAVDLPSPPATAPTAEDAVAIPPAATPRDAEPPEAADAAFQDAATLDGAAAGEAQPADPPGNRGDGGRTVAGEAHEAHAVPPAASPAEDAPAAAPDAGADTPAVDTAIVDEVVAVAGAIEPRFDAARIGTSRTVVLAGSSAPDTVIRLRRDGDVIDETVADAAGDWVSVPTVALEPGAYALTVESIDPTGGGVTSGSERLIIHVGRPGQADDNLAVLVDDGAVTPSVPLQVPAPVEPAPVDPAAAHPDGGERVRSAASPSSENVVAPGGAEPVDLAAVPPADTGPPPAIPSRLAVDVIDYDQTGAMVVSGRGTPATEVRLYLDNALVGRGRVGDDGAYRVRPNGAVSAGRYDLRVDQVDAAGRVASRVELPFERAAAADLDRGARQIIIQPGDYLWEIARETYGTGFRFVVIYQANRDRIRDPDLIYPGQVFSLPNLDNMTDSDPG